MAWLQHLNLKLFLIEEDGNCLFRAMSHQLYGSQDCHAIIRKRCCDYIELETDYFNEYVANVAGTLTLSNYVNNMRRNRTWGGNLELIAFSELYRKTIEVYRSSPQPDHVFGLGYSSAQNEEPIRMHYRNGFYSIFCFLILITYSG